MQICNGGGCGDKLKTELVKDLKQNAKDTLGKPMPTWGDVFRHPIKTAKDLASRPIDFAKKQAGSLKEDLGNSVDRMCLPPTHSLFRSVGSYVVGGLSHCVGRVGVGLRLQSI